MRDLEREANKRAIFSRCAGPCAIWSAAHGGLNRRAEFFSASGGTAAGEPLAIKGGAHQLPLQVYFLQSAQVKTPEAEHAFDDAEDRFGRGGSVPQRPPESMPAPSRAGRSENNKRSSRRARQAAVEVKEGLDVVFVLIGGLLIAFPAVVRREFGRNRTA